MNSSSLNTDWIGGSGVVFSQWLKGVWPLGHSLVCRAPTGLPLKNLRDSLDTFCHTHLDWDRQESESRIVERKKGYCMGYWSSIHCWNMNTHGRHFGKSMFCYKSLTAMAIVCTDLLLLQKSYVLKWHPLHTAHFIPSSSSSAFGTLWPLVWIQIDHVDLSSQSKKVSDRFGLALIWSIPDWTLHN